MKHFKFSAFLACMFLRAVSYAQTTVPSNIVSDTTWTPGGNPYIITGTCTINTGATLTIDPGVIVKFNNAASLEVDGKLHAIGNITDTIIFTSNLSTPSPGCWTGIKAIWTGSPSPTGEQIKMEYVSGLYADKFIDMDLAYDGPYTFKNCRFGYNKKVNHDGGLPSAIWEYCKFDHNWTSLESCQFYSRVSHSLFVNNIDGAMGIIHNDTCTFMYNTGIALSPYGATVGCTVQHNYIGVSCYFNASNNTFIKNNVSNNTSGVEILTYFNGSITFQDNYICNNTMQNIKMVAPFATNNADLSLNCWCSSDSTYIRSKIYDSTNDASLGAVTFLPLGSACSFDTLGIKELNNISEINADVFPNPFNNTIKVKIKDGQGVVRITLYDALSRKVYESRFSNAIVIDATQLLPGPYIYIVVDEKGCCTNGKLIKG
jgi:parallel beta-helix repeat protein